MSIVDELVGEGKKFATVEDALKGKIEADEFIGQLKNENKELRTLLGTAMTAEERAATVQTILSKLNAGASNTPGTTPGAQGKGADGNQSVKALTADDARKLFLEMEQAKKADENIRAVEETLVAKFGDKTKVEQAIAQRAVELGVTEGVLKSLAATSPKAYLRMMGLDQQTSMSGGSTASRSAVNTAALTTDGLVRDKAFYDKKKAEMGATKFALDSKLQQQMWRDMKALGDRFDSASV